jgi:hypothetical protein
VRRGRTARGDAMPKRKAPEQGAAPPDAPVAPSQKRVHYEKLERVRRGAGNAAIWRVLPPWPAPQAPRGRRGVAAGRRKRSPRCRGARGPARGGAAGRQRCWVCAAARAAPRADAATPAGRPPARRCACGGRRRAPTPPPQARTGPRWSSGAAARASCSCATTTATRRRSRPATCRPPRRRWNLGRSPTSCRCGRARWRAAGASGEGPRRGGPAPCQPGRPPPPPPPAAARLASLWRSPTAAAPTPARGSAASSA